MALHAAQYTLWPSIKSEQALGLQFLKMLSASLLFTLIACAPRLGLNDDLEFNDGPTDFVPNTVLSSNDKKPNDDWWAPLLPPYYHAPSFQMEPVQFTTPVFPKIDPKIETPVSATSFLNSLPQIRTESSPDVPADVTFCWKKTLTRPFSLQKPCPEGSDVQKGFGICYPPCPPSTVGFGPVCWSQCPPSLPFSCGGSCTRTSNDCVSSIFTQFSSVSEVVYNLAAVLRPNGQMTLKPLKQFTNAATQSLVRKKLDQVLRPALGSSTDEIINMIMKSVFNGQQPEWGNIDKEKLKLVYQAFYKPMCPSAILK
jgi:hypothetical protein